MRQWLTALGATCALAATATAQQAAPPLGGGQMVGSNTNVSLTPAAPRVPAAAPQAGKSIGSPLLRPYDPTRPYDALKGTGLNAKDVIAPVTGTKQLDLMDRVTDKLNSVTRFLTPSPPAMAAQTTVTPGIFRRNRERNKMEWRRD